MSIPPQLESDLTKLRERFEISTDLQGNRILVVLRKYPVPSAIWTQAEVDLLIITDIAYPNSRIDMFWVYPKIFLREGNKIPDGANSDEVMLGKTWQRFSWHVQAWNPAHDNIISYLDTVDWRLCQKR